MRVLKSGTRALGLALTAILCLSSVSASADEQPDQESSGDASFPPPQAPVSFALFGGPDAGPDGTVSPLALQLAGVDPGQIDSAMQQAVDAGLPGIDMVNGDTFVEQSWVYPDFVGTDEDMETDALTPSSPAYQLISSWSDHKKRPLAIRKGAYNGTTGNGWGLAKVTGKHNLTLRAVRAATRYTDIRFQNGTSQTWTYYQVVKRYTCSGWAFWRKCKVAEVSTVLTQHQFGTVYNDGRTRGVITAYCLNHQPKCPNWVKNALNI